MPRAGQTSAAPSLVSDERLSRMRGGAEALWGWLESTVRDGIARLEESEAGLTERVARLHDAQLPGLARWLQFIGERIGDGPGWPSVVVGELGRLAIATKAWTRWDHLHVDVQHGLLVRSGVVVRKQTVLALGDRVPGLWSVIGQHLTEDDRGLSTRRTALMGPRPAMVVEHQFGTAPPATLAPGAELFAELAFWPGRGAIRARIVDAETTGEWRPDGALSLGDVREHLALHYARAPLTAQIPLAIRDVRVVVHEGRAWVADDTDALPTVGLPWDAVAASVGGPVVVGGWWTGHAVAIAGVVVGERFVPIDAVERTDGPPRAQDALTRELLVGGRMARLLEAGIRRIERRANPPRVRVPLPAVSHDTTPVMSASAVRVFDGVLQRHPKALEMVVASIVAMKERPDGSLLTRLLGAPASQWQDVEPVLGPHARQVAALDDRWRWAADLPIDVGWDREELRVSCVHSECRQRPRTALLEVQQRWGDVSRAADRLALLDVLAIHESVVNEGFLDGLLDDSSKTVRRRAAALLAQERCPDFVARMTQRAETWWPLREQHRARQVPTTLDDAALRDGLGPDLSTVSARERVWMQTVACVPPSSWSGQVDWDHVDDVVGHALGLAIVRFADREMAARWTALDKTFGLPRASVTALLRLVEPSERMRWFDWACERRVGDVLPAIVTSFPQPWGDEVTQAWRDGLEQHARFVSMGVGRSSAGWSDTLFVACRAVPLDRSEAVTTPLDLPRATDPITQHLIGSLRDAAEWMGVRERLISFPGSPRSATLANLG